MEEGDHLMPVQLRFHTLDDDEEVARRACHAGLVCGIPSRLFLS